MNADELGYPAHDDPPGDTSMDTALIVSLAASALLAFGYRVFRVSKGGPVQDAWGGAVLALSLGIVAALVGAGVEWATWVALGYGLLFGIVVMPIWILGVFIPLRPGPFDYVLTGAYFLSLVAVVIFALVS